MRKGSDAVYAHPIDPDDLLQQLLEMVGNPPDENTGMSGESLRQRQIVYETEVNGVRYALTRTASPQASILLSPREQEIARLITEGLPNKTIAATLDISPWTVGTYIKRIFAKLSVNSRAEMVAKLLRDDLLKSTHAERPRRYPYQFPAPITR